MTSSSPARSPSNLGLFVSVMFVTTALAAGCGNSTSALSHTGGAGTTGSAGSGKTGHAGSTGGGGTTSGGGATGTAGGGMTGGGGAGAKIPIGQTQCSDGIDNDGDGLIDLADPECTSSADNDESSYATGIPGDNVDPCKQDCFFDGNSGMGDDGCQWELKCDPRSTNAKCPYDANYAQQHATQCSTTASQSQHCIDFCKQFVPNGCDCFGCCAVPGAPTPIRLDPTCTSKDFNDPTKCSPCTQVTQCMKTCDRCELCVGKTTVPEDCGPTTDTDGGAPGDSGVTPPPHDGGGGTPVCSYGQSCTPGPVTGCPANNDCLTGCCVPIIP
jgi:hypothetical protein